MVNSKEFREFFLRHVTVTSGTKPDQETGFPISYYIGSTPVYNRFLKNDYPTENVFKKLFASITFKLNKEDTAKLDQQGLTKIATDDQSVNRTDNSISDYTAMVVPHQLPEIINDLAVSGDVVIDTVNKNGITITRVARTVSGQLRLIYKVTPYIGDSITIVGDKLELVNDSNTPGNYFYYGTDAGGLKGWFDLSALITSIADDEVDDIVTPLLRHKFVKSFVGVVGDVTILYSEISSAHVFNVDTLGSGTVDKPKVDYIVNIMASSSGGAWTHSTLSYSIDFTSGDLTIIGTGAGTITYRVIIIG